MFGACVDVFVLELNVTKCFYDIIRWDEIAYGMYNVSLLIFWNDEYSNFQKTIPTVLQ